MTTNSGGRLTVLSSGNFRRRKPAAENTESRFQPQPEDDPKSGFGAFSAVPESTPSFGNR